MLDIATIDKTGKALYACLREMRTMPPLSVQFPDLTIDDAYKISREFLSHRTTSGEKIVGKKIGVTSPAVQEMLGEYGIPLHAGEIVLSGSLVPLAPASAGDHFTMSIDGLGGAEVRFR
jgi:2-keto-4-pentenoate hydratase